MCIGKFPAQRHEAGHFRPRAVGDEQRVGADVERRRRAEFAAPQPDGAHVLKVLVQHVRHHAEHVGQVRRRRSRIRSRQTTIVVKFSAHDSDCFAPIRRSRPGGLRVSIMRPAKVAHDQLVERLRRPVRLAESVLVAGEGRSCSPRRLRLCGWSACTHSVFACSHASRLLAFQLLSRFCVGTWQRKNTS